MEIFEGLFTDTPLSTSSSTTQYIPNIERCFKCFKILAVLLKSLIPETTLANMHRCSFSQHSFDLDFPRSFNKPLSLKNCRA